MLNWLKAQELISSNLRRKEPRLQDQMENTNNIKMRKNFFLMKSRNKKHLHNCKHCLRHAKLLNLVEKKRKKKKLEYLYS